VSSAAFFVLKRSDYIPIIIIFARMKISYNWLKKYIKTELPVLETAKLLTDCGLEVESVEKFQSLKGGLEGVVVGEVITKEKHPDADRLSLTTVDVGTGTLLSIVCGASNVAAGQKVVVATVGATLYPSTGEPINIKKSKIRGALSEGMICAEDEIGLGTSHDGIMVLDASVKVGTRASDYFKIENDDVFEIGLTPNRADAASHIGVARDLAAVINTHNEAQCKLELPDVRIFKTANASLTIEVTVEDSVACPRYSGLSISAVKVKESPSWLKNSLAAIGIRSINNIVDITNFVLHELGQPLHAFDADKIKGKRVIVKKLPAQTKFTTLDGTERELNAEDLMICDANDGMCIAGVFGGVGSGVSEGTKNIFLESAYFDSVHIRKTSKRFGLKTDASFRYERGTDPNITVYALKRAALLITEIAGGEISSEIVDIYPTPVENFKVTFSYTHCDLLIGKQIDREKIKSILSSLDIEIISEGHDALLLSVPPYRVDVRREADVIEEVLRIYGYNNVELPDTVHSALSFVPKPDPEKIQNTVSDLLSSNGFNEVFTNSITKAANYEGLESFNPEQTVKLLNPLSSDLNVMRRAMLFSGLEVISYNQNRKMADLKLYEFGKTYLKGNSGKYIEERRLALYIVGRKEAESWNVNNDIVTFYTMKGMVEAVLTRLGIPGIKSSALTHEFLSEGLEYSVNKRTLVAFGKVKNAVLKKADVKTEVFYADFNWDNVLELLKKNTILYKEVPKFPEVRRDLALLIDRTVKYEQLEQLAFQTEKNLLRSVNLFDVYEGDKIEKGKKSYALSFVLQDVNATLTDKQIDKVMERLQASFEEKLNAVIRKN